MTLQELLNIHGKIDWRQTSPVTEVSGLCFDSRQVKSGDVYVAVRGSSGDGHDYLKSAITSGAIALVVESKQNVPDDYTGVVVEVLESRIALQTLSQNLYSKPGDQMTSIAVTGTNGKTSLTYLFEYLLNQVGRPCGVIGTIDHHLGKKLWPTSLTTPDPVTLQQRLRDFYDNGAESFVIEASSHALDQNRIHQGFDLCVFTNLSRDHLDYHPDMEHYFLSKAKLFEATMLKEGSDGFAVINGDDQYGKRLASDYKSRMVLTYGLSDHCDFKISDIKSGLDGSVFRLQYPKGFINVVSPLLGRHNVENVTAALAGMYCLGANIGTLAPSLKNFTGIPGRVQTLRSKDGVYGIVDYAHTPDALEKTLSSVRELLPADRKLISVFGCGGDRDKGKRPLMAKAAEANSDLVIVTSDNPRSEDPAAIIADIIQGLSGGGYEQEVDRRKAIEKAISVAEEGDAIVIAGKGHEDYQIIGDKKLHFDDFETLTELLS